MSESLADTLGIAALRLPPDLVPRSERDRLLREAKRLAPTQCAGFECRLTGARGRVDLQQRITPRDAEPARLAAHLLAAGLCTRPGWRRIRDFMLAWSGGKRLPQIAECWLEYESAADASAPPSVFVSFNRRGKAGDCAPALRQALALLAPPATARRLARAAQEIAGRLPDGARIYEIGLMARRPAVLRVNIGGVAGARLAGVLAAFGWDRREQARVGELARAASPYARHFKIAFDWHGQLLQRVGLEIIPGDVPELPISDAAQARWRGLLAWLCARKACHAGRAAALLDWPGEDEPPDCRLPWPESLIVESLLREPEVFSTIGRRLGHVKVDFLPGRHPAAKAYFGFIHLWRSAPDVAATRATASRLREAIARATAFLLAQRSPGGGWHDFGDLDGGSGEWLSAYVAAALAGTAGRKTGRAARETWNLLSRHRARPGWGYNMQIPVDADSSLWALRLAAAVGRTGDPAAKSALRLVRRHRLRNGGIATFVGENLGASRSAAGWCQAHAEVTAAAGALPGFARASAAWLLRAQQPDGRWRAYWYDEDAFATALAAEHLAIRRGPASRRARMRASRWAAARVAADGAVSGRGRSGESAFAAACCLRILLAAPHSAATRAAIGRLCRWLAAAQSADGGWRGSAPLRLPLPGDRRPATFGARLGFARDGSGFFTTATVLDALSRVAASARQDGKARVPQRNGVAASANRPGTPSAARPRRSGNRRRRR